MSKRSGVSFFSFKRMLTVTKKEFIHIKRDKPSLIISFLMPIMMLLIFGYAVNTDVNNVAFAVYDESNTALSRELIESFSNSYYFTHYSSVHSVVEVEALIKAGDIKVGIIIPADYAKDLKRNVSTNIQVLVDNSDPTIAKENWEQWSS